MSTERDHELRRLARAMVAEDDPPTIPSWPLDVEADADPDRSGGWGGRRLWASAAAVILVVGAIAVLIGVGLGDDAAAPADSPVPTAPQTGVATSTPTTAPPATVTSTVVPPTIASTAPTSPTVPITTPPSEAATSAVTVPDSCVGAPGGDFEYPLERCDSGLAVAVLRQQLIAKGYLPPSAADNGDFDDLVEAAVRAFQTDHHLAVDGLVGPITWAAITADYQRLVGDPNGDGRLDPAEVYIVGDSNEP